MIMKSFVPKFLISYPGRWFGFFIPLTLAMVFSGEGDRSAHGQDLPDQILVLGVIADSRPQRGVALVKAESTSRTYAVRVGQEVKSGIILEKVDRQYVYVTIKGNSAKIKVGASFRTDQVDLADRPKEILNDYAVGDGIERTGNIIKVTSSLREYVAGPSLSKVLMQAAAVPQYLNGELRGFGLFEIEKDSVYEKAGFKNGDVIMVINGQTLNNVGQAIKVLHSLKTENEVEVELVRDGQEQKLTFHIQ